MKLRLILLIVLFPLILKAVPVTFQVNMNEQIRLGKFNASTEFVDLAGTMNNWGANLLRLTDNDKDGIHEITIDLAVGTEVFYKFRLNGSWDGREEFPGEGNDRSYTVNAENNVVFHWYNDAISPNAVFAGFSASSQRVQPGELVLFTTQTANADLTYLWTFEGGSPATSASAAPAVYFTETGSFDVELIVSNGTESDTVRSRDFIKVEEAGTGWWNDAVFYEIFVRSFYDSDGNGIGDFQGLIQKLDYLNDGNPETFDDLGVTGIWLMPMHEAYSYHGYDVSDYRKVEQDYGSDQDFRDFLDAAHQRGIRVIIDYVMNHSSDRHDWFRASRDPNSEKRSWYRWSATKPGYKGPWGQEVWHGPDNGAYYYGLFWSGMPDLNYEHAGLKAEMFDIARYWLEDYGVDGFRLDAVKFILEEGSTQEDTRATLDFWKEFRTFYKGVDPEAFAVGEAWTNTDKVVDYVENSGLDFCFEFDLATRILDAVRNRNANSLRDHIRKVNAVYPLHQYGVFLTNHDQDRVLSNLSLDITKTRQAAGIYLTLPGIPFIYYGEEIGMTGFKPDEYIRTPMQWNSEPHSGFTDGNPWIAVNGEYPTINVENQHPDQNSLLNYYRQLIHVRNREEALRTGNIQILETGRSAVLAYLRSTGEESVLVIHNLGSSPIQNLTLTSPISNLLPGVYPTADLLGGGTTGPVIVNENGAFDRWTPVGTLKPQTSYIIKFLEEGTQNTDVLMKVDLRLPIQNGRFDPAADFLDIAGDFNFWGMVPTRLEDVDGDSIYTVELRDKAVGVPIAYKFRINGQDQGSEFSDANRRRRYITQDGINIVYHWFGDTKELSTPTAVEEPLWEQTSLLVFPNPVQEKAQLRLSGPDVGKVDLQILDNNGRILLNRKMEKFTEQVVWELPFQHLPIGTYQIRLLQGERQKITTLIKQ